MRKPGNTTDGEGKQREQRRMETTKEVASPCCRRRDAAGASPCRHCAPGRPPRHAGTMPPALPTRWCSSLCWSPESSSKGHCPSAVCLLLVRCEHHRNATRRNTARHGADASFLFLDFSSMWANSHSALEPAVARFPYIASKCRMTLALHLQTRAVEDLNIPPAHRLPARTMIVGEKKREKRGKPQGNRPSMSPTCANGQNVITGQSCLSRSHPRRLQKQEYGGQPRRRRRHAEQAARKARQTHPFFAFAAFISSSLANST